MADMRMTPERLQAIKQRCQRATDGPWEVEGRGGVYMNGRRDAYIVVQRKTGRCLHAPTWTFDDAMFVAHAREDVPALVAEVERLWKENRRLHQEIQRAVPENDCNI